MPLKWSVAAAARSALVLLVLAPAAACNQRETLLTVHATGATRTAPDLAVVTLGVVARGPTAQAAQQAQGLRMQSVMEAARAAGVAEADVQTIGYALEPQYAYVRGAPPRLAGYVSRNTISLRVRKLDAVSALIDATVAQGANELHGIQFTYLDDEASRDAARAQAVEIARRRAETYAKAARMRIVRTDSITEQGAPVPEARRRGGMLAAAPVVEQAANGSIAPGELDNRASVTVVFELR